jgi:hypothetical protein
MAPIIPPKKPHTSSDPQGRLSSSKVFTAYKTQPEVDSDGNKFLSIFSYFLLDKKECGRH